MHRVHCFSDVSSNATFHIVDGLAQALDRLTSFNVRHTRRVRQDRCKVAWQEEDSHLRHASQELTKAIQVGVHTADVKHAVFDSFKDDMSQFPLLVPASVMPEFEYCRCEQISRIMLVSLSQLCAGYAESIHLNE